LTGYVRDASGHNEGSNTISRVIDVNAGDTLKIQTLEMGNSGTVTMRANESILTIEQLSASSAPISDADTLDGLEATEFVKTDGSTPITSAQAINQTNQQDFLKLNNTTTGDTWDLTIDSGDNFELDLNNSQVFEVSSGTSQVTFSNRVTGSSGFDAGSSSIDNTTEVNTTGSGSASFDVYDSANTQNIAIFNEGGNVEIPNGRLQGNGSNSITQFTQIGRRLDDSVHIEWPDFSVLEFRDGNNTVKMRIDEGAGDAEILNSGLQVPDGQLQLQGGSATSPALTFSSDTDTGIYRNEADHIKFSTNGNLAFEINQNQNSIFRGGYVSLAGNRLLSVGGETDANTGDIRLANGASINARNSGDTADFGINFTSNDRLQITSNINHVGNDLVNINRIRQIGLIRSDTTNNLSIETAGGGSEFVTIDDQANNQTIAQFNEGGNVSIPSGGLTVSGSSTFQSNVDIQGELDATFIGPGSGTGDTIFIRADSETRIQDYSNTVATFSQNGNHNVNIPNGGLTVSGSSTFQSGLTSEGDISLATGQSIVDGSGTARVDITGVDTEISDPDGDRAFSARDTARAIYALDSKPFRLYDENGPFEALEYTTGASAGDGSFTFDGDTYLKNGNGLVVGDTTLDSITGITPQLQVNGTSWNDSSLRLTRYESASSSPPFLVFGKSRSGTVGTEGTAVQTGDSVLRLEGYGDDGTDLGSGSVSGRLDVAVDGSVSTDTVPGRFEFSTTDSTGSLTEALRIDSNQDVIVQNGDLLFGNSKIFDSGSDNLTIQANDVLKLISGASGGANGIELQTNQGTIAKVENNNLLMESSGSTLQLQDGSAASPALTFSSDTDTGLFSATADKLSITAGGSRSAFFIGGGISLDGNNLIGVGGTPDANTGDIRLADDTSIRARNSDDTADITLIETAGAFDGPRIGGANSQAAMMQTNLRLQGNQITRVGGFTDASSGAIRMANDTGIFARDSGNSNDIRALTVDASDRIRIGNTNESFILAASDLSLNGSDIVAVGGVTDASSGAIRMANASQIAWRNSGDSADHHIEFDGANDFDVVHGGGTNFTVGSDGNVEIPNGNLDMGSNDINGINILQQSPSFGNLSLYTAGGGTDGIQLRDTANGQNIAVFEEGGTANILNGPLVMWGNNITDIGGTTDANSGAIRLGNSSALKWRNEADSADVRGIEVNAFDSVIVGGGGNTNNVILGADNGIIRADGNNITRVGGTTDASTGAIRLANGASINAPNNGGTGDFGLTFTGDDTIQVDADVAFAPDTSLQHDRQDVSTNITTDGSGYYSVDTSGGAVTVTLATADATDGKEINIKRNGANDMTINTEGTQTIDGSSSITLSVDDEAATVVYNGTNSDWEVF
jgi:hypothetical protein